MTVTDYINEIDRQYRLQDAVYHNAAVKLGLSDSALCALYLLSDFESCTQQELCNRCFFPKQTVNSSILKLAKGGYLVLETIPGTHNQKKIVLTDAGRTLIQKKVTPLKQAEQRAYGNFSEEELSACLSVMAKLTAALKAETEKMEEVE